MTKLERFLGRVWERKVPFFGVFFVVMLVTYALMVIIDFVPEPVTSNTDQSETEDVATTTLPTTTASTEVQKVVEKIYPESIYFDSLGRGVKVLNPESSDLAVLDEALLNGVVRHPDSVDLSEEGNMLILGHSSYLPTVFNKNFQAFNDVQKLTWGDKIRVRTADTEYVYRVEKVYQAKASEVFVPDTPGESKLTLATCNVLGAKEDRFIVEASLVGSFAI